MHGFRPVAKSIQRLELKREYSASYFGEYFYRTEIEELRLFDNLKEIYFVCADGLLAWTDLFDVHDYCFRCGVDNVFFIDPEDDEVVFRGPEGLDEISCLAFSSFIDGNTGIQQV